MDSSLTGGGNCKKLQKRAPHSFRISPCSHFILETKKCQRLKILTLILNLLIIQATFGEICWEAISDYCISLIQKTWMHLLDVNTSRSCSISNLLFLRSSSFLFNFISSCNKKQTKVITNTSNKSMTNWLGVCVLKLQVAYEKIKIKKNLFLKNASPRTFSDNASSQPEFWRL